MNDTIFYNADYIVIEYIDLIKSPYLMLLSQIKKNDKLRDIFKIEEIEFLNDAALYEWYINRKHQNFFIDLNRYPEKISNNDLDRLLEDQIKITPKFYKFAMPLNLVRSLKFMRSKHIVNDVIIYHPHQNFFAKNDLENITDLNFTFESNFDNLIDKTKANSTYFLSDIDKIQKLKDKGYLKFSSITIPLEYRYNKKNMHDFKYDLDELCRNDPFKLSFISACTKDFTD